MQCTVLVTRGADKGYKDPLRHQSARRLQVSFKQHLDVSSTSRTEDHLQRLITYSASLAKPRLKTSTSKPKHKPPTTSLPPRMPMPAMATHTLDTITLTTTAKARLLTLAMLKRMMTKTMARRWTTQA